MDIKAYRFDGLHLEPIRGALATSAGFIQETSDFQTIRVQRGEPGRYVPTFAALYVDVLLQEGETVGVQAGIARIEDASSCDDHGPKQFQRMYLIVPDIQVVIGNRRQGGVIVTRLQNEDGELRIVSQDKPAGC